MATVIIPALLRKLTGGQDRTVATGTTLGDIVNDLERQFPGFRERVVRDGDLDGSLAVSIDGEIITGGLSEPVSANSEVHFVPAIGGGN
jgi:molybdopterin synthase sulfur carrier subunit